MHPLGTPLNVRPTTKKSPAQGGAKGLGEGVPSGSYEVTPIISLLEKGGARRLFEGP
jgi:hypothetical protein